MNVNASAREFPRDVRVHLLLDDAPHYRNSIHDDAVARARGYKAALIPGAFVYGHISRLAVEAWGAEWIERGAISARFRKPAYNHDNIVVSGSALVEEGDSMRSDVSVRNEGDEEIATGWIALPHGMRAPDPLRRLELLSSPEEAPVIAAGSLSPGELIRSRDRLLAADDVEASRRAFGEDHPLYRQSGYVHPGMLMRLAMGDVNSGWRFPTAVVLVEAEAQHFRPVFAGQRLRTAGWIDKVYERKGKHYFVSEEYLLADAQIAARFRRTQIYG